MTTRTFRSQRGAIVVQVAVSILVLSAFAMFIVDYGVLWVSRHQAQNAADSGAMAGAVALAFDDYGDRADSGPAKQAARSFALANNVFGEDPVVNMATDVRFFGGASFPNVCSDDSCVQVDVYRNVARGNPLPVIFGWIVGLTDQGVRATAIARVTMANASECLKPWGLADRWAENNPVPASEWLPESTFDPTGPSPDTYTPPSSGGPGTSFRVTGDLGRELVLRAGNANDPAINGGWFQALNVSGGAGTYSDAISGCVKKTWVIGDVIPLEGGDVAGSTRDATEDLIALDPDAEWNGEKIINSCVGPPYSCATPGHSHSPRLVAVPVLDLQQFVDTGGPGNGTARVVNIVGFFVDHLDGNDVVGYLAMKPDLKVLGASVAQAATFIKTVQLVR